jgi:two-component system, sensor histidine kinase LadS
MKPIPHWLPFVRYIFTVALLVGGVGFQPAHAQPLVEVSSLTKPLPLPGYLAFLRDSTRHLGIDEIRHQQAAFALVQSPVANFGYTANRTQAKPIWLRFSLHNASNQPRPLYAQVNFWCFDSLQFFLVVRDSVQIATASLGWQTPVEHRLVHSRHFLFPFTLQPHQQATAYIRVLKSRGTQIVPVAVLPQKAFDGVIQAEYLFWGGTLFGLAFVTLMSFFFFLTTNDRIYFKYTLCLIGLTGFFAINEGFLNQFAFPVQSWFPGQNIYFLFPLLLFYSQLVFIRSFISLRNTPAYRWHHIGTGVLICGAVCLFFLFIERIVSLPAPLEGLFMRFFTICYWLPMPVIGAYIFISIVRGYNPRAAWFYLIAVTPFYVLNFGQVMANFGLIQTYPAMAYYAYLAVAALFEVLVLTLGLAYRYKMLRDESEQSAHESSRQQRLTYEADLRTLAVENTLLLEKERIGRDLHDNVGAHLSFVATSLAGIVRQANKQPVVSTRDWTDHLTQLIGATREAIGMLRDTIWAVHHDELTLAEFGERLRQYVHRSVPETGGLLVTVAIEGELTEPLTSGQVLNLFRIVQEALNNVVKHAGASQVRVSLLAQPNNHIQLQISDNGRGLTEKTIDALDRHYGLQNMQRRAEELGGQFRIYSKEGTTVEVAV